MAEAEHRPQPVKQKTGLLSALISFITHMVAILFLSLIISIIIEWVGIAFLWPEQGAKHSHAMMIQEMGYLSTEFQQSLIIPEPQKSSQILLGQTYHYLFVKTGVEQWMLNAKNHPEKHWSYPIYYYLSAYLESVIYITLVFMIRLFILVLTSPLFIMAAIVGVADGLARRDRRCFGSGYESGFVYHHAKRAISPLFMTAWFIYLALPFSLHPNWILIPAAFLFGLAISIMFGAFKKYL